MSETRYVVCFYNAFPVEVEFDTLQDAERYMRSEGYVPANEQASDAETEGGHILWDGYCDFWTEEGRMLDSYGEGHEPRIRVLTRAGSREIEYAD